MPAILIRRQLVTDAFESQYPELSMTGVYCQFTGKLIATYSIDEVRELIDSIPGHDPEAIADDLAVRIIASQRPSLRWNKLHRESIDQLRKSHPVETLAWLMNRLMAPVSHETGADILTIQHDRIRLYQHLCSLESGVVSEWLFMLIEIDARLNVNVLHPPFTTHELCSLPLDALRKRLNSWHSEMKLKAERDEAHRESTARWYRDGNTLSKRAHVSQFMESQPPSQKSIREAAKREEKAVMSSLLRTLMADSGVRPLPEGIKRPKNEGSQPKPKPTIPLTQRGAFGGKMPSFGAKKES